MKSILSLFLLFSTVIIAQQQPPKGDPKPVINPTTGTRLPDTTHYARYRGNDKPLFKAHRQRRSKDPVAPYMDSVRPAVK